QGGGRERGQGDHGEHRDQRHQQHHHGAQGHQRRAPAEREQHDDPDAEADHQDQQQADHQAERQQPRDLPLGGAPDLLQAHLPPDHRLAHRVDQQPVEDRGDQEGDEAGDRVADQRRLQGGEQRAGGHVLHLVRTHPDQSVQVLEKAPGGHALHHGGQCHQHGGEHEHHRGVGADRPDRAVVDLPDGQWPQRDDAGLRGRTPCRREATRLLAVLAVAAGLLAVVGWALLAGLLAVAGWALLAGLLTVGGWALLTVAGWALLAGLLAVAGWALLAGLLAVAGWALLAGLLTVAARRGDLAPSRRPGAHLASGPGGGRRRGRWLLTRGVTSRRRWPVRRCFPAGRLGSVLRWRIRVAHRAL